MPTRHLLALCAIALVAGCFTDATNSPEAAGAAIEPDPSREIDATAASSPRSLTVPILLDGSTGTQAFVCADAAPTCAYHSVVSGESDLIMEALGGRIVGGQLALAWDAATPATEELAFGIMIMGVVAGPSPRGALALLRLSRAHAFIMGRNFVTRRG